MKFVEGKLNPVQENYLKGLIKKVKEIILDSIKTKVPDYKIIENEMIEALNKAKNNFEYNKIKEEFSKKISELQILIQIIFEVNYHKYPIIYQTIPFYYKKGILLKHTLTTLLDKSLPIIIFGKIIKNKHLMNKYQKPIYLALGTTIDIPEISAISINLILIQKILGKNNSIENIIDSIPMISNFMSSECIDISEFLLENKIIMENQKYIDIVNRLNSDIYFQKYLKKFYYLDSKTIKLDFPKNSTITFGNKITEPQGILLPIQENKSLIYVEDNIVLNKSIIYPSFKRIIELLT